MNTSKPARPKKPRPDFPLFAHASGRWAKKVRGKFEYFGRWADDPDGKRAEQSWRDFQQNGRRTNRDALTVKKLFDAFLTFKEGLVKSGELAPRSWENYFIGCSTAAGSLGKFTLVEELKPDDFQTLRGVFARRWGAVRLGNMIGVVRMAFNYAVESDLIDRPIKFGPGFKKPAAKVLRQQREKNGPRMFEPAQVQALLDHADPLMRAVVLLGINGALGNTDIGLIPMRAIDLDRGWLTHPRAKTAINRRIPLWSETVDAVRLYLRTRPEPGDAADRGFLFIGPRGLNLAGSLRGSRVSDSFRRLARRAKVEGRQFYDLRRTFQTIGEGARDLPAVQSIMGHAAASGDMSATYRQTIEDARLQAVTDHVHAWLYDTAKPKPR